MLTCMLLGTGVLIKTRFHCACGGLLQCVFSNVVVIAGGSGVGLGVL